MALRKRQRHCEKDAELAYVSYVSPIPDDDMDNPLDLLLSPFLLRPEFKAIGIFLEVDDGCNSPKLAYDVHLIRATRVILPA